MGLVGTCMMAGLEADQELLFTIHLEHEVRLYISGTAYVEGPVVQDQYKTTITSVYYQGTIILA